jgi:hypothetical protein
MTKSGAQRRYHPSSPFQAPPPPVVERFAAEDRVTHDTYGLGVVVEGDETAVVVDFGSQRVRVTSPFTKLTKL